MSAFDSSLVALSSSTALSGSAPFINRTVGSVAGIDSFAGLGNGGAAADPLAAIKTAATTYFANTTSSQSSNSTATVAGLASALSALSTTSGGTTVSVTATEATTGNDDLINLTLTSTSSVAATPTTLSVTAGQNTQGNTLSGSQSLTETTVQKLSLVFGVDVANSTAPVFEVTMKPPA